MGPSPRGRSRALGQSGSTSTRIRPPPTVEVGPCRPLRTVKTTSTILLPSDPVSPFDKKEMSLIWVPVPVSSLRARGETLSLPRKNKDRRVLTYFFYFLFGSKKTLSSKSSPRRLGTHVDVPTLETRRGASVRRTSRPPEVYRCPYVLSFARRPERLSMDAPSLRKG